jgi:F0F1-type ATP synthase membrane subunit b/b'
MLAPRRRFALLLAAASIAAVPACGSDDVDDARDRVEQGVDDAKDTATDAADDARDKAEDAADDAKRKAEDAADDATDGN